MSNDVNFKLVSREVYQKRFFIAGFTLAAAVLAVVILLLQPNYYRATTTFYSGSDDIYTPEKVYGLTQTPTRYYGGDTETDRLLTLANSTVFYSTVIAENDLYTHYDIDTTTERYRLKAKRKLGKLLEVRKNEYEALELSVEDKDPVKAASIANSARSILDRLNAEMYREGLNNLRSGIKEDLSQQEQRLSNIRDSIDRLRIAYGIVDPDEENEKLAGTLAKLRSDIMTDRARISEYQQPGRRITRADQDSLRKFSSRLAANETVLGQMMGMDTTASLVNIRDFSRGSNAILVLQNLRNGLMSAIVADRIRLQQLDGVYLTEKPTLIVSEVASVPERKFRPRRSIILVAVTAFAFFASLIGVLIFYSLRSIDWHEITSA